MKEQNTIGETSVLTWSVFIASAIIGLLAVSSSSLWIDEAHSAWKATTGTLPDFWAKICFDVGSDTQMPGYMAFLWVWEKVTGPSEYALRGMNVLWFLGAQFAFGFLLRATSLTRFFTSAAALTSSFVWYYLDEARPYAMQLCGASWVAVAIWNRAFFGSIEATIRDVSVLCVGAAILCASSLLGVLHMAILGFLFLFVVFYIRPPASLLRSRRLLAVLAATVVFMAVLAAYYAWTLTLGARASLVGRTNLATIGFSLYEFFAFSGFGPGRLELRDGGPMTLLPYLAWLVVPTIAYSVVALWVLFAKKKPLPAIPVIVVAGFVLVAFGGISLMGVLTHFRVLGRHFMPLAPFLFLTLGTCYSGMWHSGNAIWKTMAIFSLGIFFAGSINQRVSPRFQKDDYRSAAAVARSALDEGKVVWWSADMPGANFYGVYPRETPMSPIPSFEKTTIDSAFFANDRSPERLSSLPRPSLIILSKVDIFDPKGTLRDWMKMNGFLATKTFAAFTIWEYSGKLEKESEVRPQ